LEFGVVGLGCGVWGLVLGFGVCGLWFGVWGLGFGVWGLGFWGWGLGFGVWGFGFGVRGLGCVTLPSHGSVRHSSRALHSRKSAELFVHFINFLFITLTCKP